MILALFYLAGAVALGATIMALTRANAAHALIYLIVSLLAVAVLFFLMEAGFRCGSGGTVRGNGRGRSWAPSVGHAAEHPFELVADVFHRQIDVEHRHLDAAMPHESHEDRERHSLTDHIDGERMTQTMGIGLRDSRPFPVIAEELAKARRRHRTPASWSLEVDEQSIVTA